MTPHKAATLGAVLDIGNSPWHFRRKVASPSPPHRDNPKEVRGEEHLIFSTKYAVDNFFFIKKCQYGYEKSPSFMLIPNPKTKCPPSYFWFIFTWFSFVDIILDVIILSSFLFCWLFLGWVRKPFIQYYAIQHLHPRLEIFSNFIKV